MISFLDGKVNLFCKQTISGSAFYLALFKMYITVRSAQVTTHSQILNDNDLGKRMSNDVFFISFCRNMTLGFENNLKLL